MLTRLQLAWLRHREKLWALHGSLSVSIEAYYHDLLRQEGRIAHVDGSSSVLFIGAGATPYTAVVLAEEFGCTVTAIDRDRIAIALARCYLARKAPSLAVCAACGKGECYDVGAFDLVMLALHAVPKRDILANLASAIGPEARILLRDPWGPWRELYEPMPEDPTELGLVVEAVLPHTGTYRFDSVVLRRDGLAAGQPTSGRRVL